MTTKSADVDHDETAGWQHSVRSHGIVIYPRVIASKAKTVVVDDNDDYEGKRIADDDDFYFDDETTSAADTSFSSSSSSSSSCCSPSWNSHHAPESTADTTTFATITTNIHTIVASDAAEGNIMMQQRPQEEEKTTGNKHTAINNNNSKMAVVTLSCSNAFPATNNASPTTNNEARTTTTTAMITKVQVCCHELRSFLTECFYSCTDKRETTMTAKNEDVYPVHVSPLFHHSTEGCSCSSSSFMAEGDALCDAIELLSCADFCYDDDLNNNINIIDGDDDRTEIHEKRRLWRLAKRKRLQQQRRMMEQQQQRRNLTDLKQEMTTMTEKENENSPIRQLFNATWYGGNSIATTVLAPAAAANDTIMKTKNEKGAVELGVLGRTATATTPRGRDGEVPRMEEKADKDTKFETSSPNTVVMTTMIVDNQAWEESENTNNIIDEHHSMSMRDYSGLSSVARELLQSIADEKTLSLLLLDDDDDHHCKSPPTPCLRTSACHPVMTSHSISQPTATKIESTSTATTTCGGERNDFTVNGMIRCRKGVPVLSPPKVRRFPTINEMEGVPDEDHEKQNVDVNYACKSGAATGANDDQKKTDYCKKMESSDNIQSEGTSIQFVVNASSLDNDGCGAHKVGLPTTVVPSEEIMTSLCSLPLDNHDMTAAPTAASTVTSSPTANLPQQPKHHQQKQQQPGCNLMRSWLQQHRDGNTNSNVLKNGIMVHVTRKVNGAFQCCQSGNDYEEEDLCMAVTMDGFDHTIQTMDQRDAAAKKVSDANIYDCIPEKNSEERVNEGTNTSTTAQPSKKHSDCFFQRRRAYCMLGKQARKRRYFPPQSTGTIPLTIAKEEGRQLMTK